MSISSRFANAPETTKSGNGHAEDTVSRHTLGFDEQPISLIKDWKTGASSISQNSAIHQEDVNDLFLGVSQRLERMIMSGEGYVHNTFPFGGVDASTISLSDDLGGGAETIISSESWGLLHTAEPNSIGIQYDEDNIYIGGAASSTVPKPSAYSKLVPNTALKEYYDHCEPRTSMTNGCFVSIMDNADGHHVPLFSSIFVCPKNGEIFLSGRLLNPQYGGDQVIERNNLIWYKKKSNSQFAAAGRALDCFHLREDKKMEERFCAEEPYQSTECAITSNNLEEFYHVCRADIAKVEDLQTKAYRKF
ncbi:hypothetical protein IV203_004343 [Nitzschia inconspicua]|uniref:Uncharacterized protein n=1 Tax=Nitzschia inconspicua TaxID=303405 RepID=A0A9K3PPK5_9STRA|nr:hypothetical protein IV203_004343 [Nitzschia inconspicua]